MTHLVYVIRDSDNTLTGAAKYRVFESCETTDEFGDILQKGRKVWRTNRLRLRGKRALCLLARKAYKSGTFISLREALGID